MQYLTKLLQFYQHKQPSWMNIQRLKQKKKPSEQLFYHLYNSKQGNINHSSNKSHHKLKISSPNPLEGKIFPEEGFIKNGFFSIQKEKDGDSKLYSLHTYRFKANCQPPKAVCIIMHGMNWHSNLLAHVADHFSSQGIEVCAYDFKGFGKSEGLQGYLPQFEPHMDDAQFFVDNIKQIYGSEIPLFICGFSLGGLTAFHLGLANPKEYKGIIFFAPALKDHPHYQRYPKILGRIIARVFPKFRVTRRSQGARSVSQRNKVIDEYFSMDELYYKQGLRAGTLRTICETMMDTEVLYKDFQVPFLLFQGGKDRLVDPDIANKMLEQSPSLDKEIVFNPEMWHGIPLEPEIDEYMKHAATWILNRS